MIQDRTIAAAPGPRFERGPDGEVLFSFVNDSSSVIGPRPAKRSDQENHPAAWGQFIASEEVGPLDRDAEGTIGGSLKAEPDAKPRAARRKAPTK